ncbi:NADPH-dependent FMN reductase [Halalkalibacter hemicellulosilyticus]|uniref:NADPH-dependent FMN reductase n=1 Tax=Halalkalibacter hemicellulosilyticusJCM 9152 TaxID=1236971 RepID=W4QBC3_9BACI|nr:NADPH-dependent FMN reductase [Halalkalibacter hemicellulosilyticus]GAE28694.1 NADPH-dependent FMN reductase [Halalkalibacter hemicellulosilyticusJCM 9152]
MEGSKLIVALSGSIRGHSATQRTLNSLQMYIPAKCEYTIYNGLHKLPHFNPDEDGETPPADVQSFRSLLDQADGVIICTPEYIKGVPGVLKNALEWLVSSATLYEKPVAVITSSGGGEHAHQALQMNLSMLQAHVSNEWTLLISGANSKQNENGEYVREEVVESLRKLIDTFAKQL